MLDKVIITFILSNEFAVKLINLTKFTPPNLAPFLSPPIHCNTARMRVTAKVTSALNYFPYLKAFSALPTNPENDLALQSRRYTILFTLVAYAHARLFYGVYGQSISSYNRFTFILWPVQLSSDALHCSLNNGLRIFPSACYSGKQYIVNLARSSSI